MYKNEGLLLYVIAVLYLFFLRLLIKNEQNFF